MSDEFLIERIVQLEMEVNKLRNILAELRLQIENLGERLIAEGETVEN